MAESSNFIPKLPRPSSNSRTSLSSELSLSSEEDEEEDLLFDTLDSPDAKSTPSSPPVGGEGRNALTVVDAKCSGLTPPPRLGCTTVVRRDTYLYVYGGALTNVIPSSVIGDDCVYRLNIATMQWRPLDNAGDSTPAARFGHTLSLFRRDAMILFGGLSQSKSDTSSTTATSTSWTPHTPKEEYFLEGLPDLKLADDSHNLWLLNVIDRTDAESAVWSKLSTPGSSPSSRLHHTATYVPSLCSLVVFGGTRPGEALGDVWEFNTEHIKWTEVEMTGTPPSPRFGHTATLPLSPTERLDATTETSNTDVDEAEDAMGRTGNEKTTIIILGGFTMSANGTPKHADSYATGTVLHLLHAKTHSWSQPKCFGSIPPAVGFHSSSMTGGDTHVLVYGGDTTISMSLKHGGGAPFVLDRLRWVWSRPQYNGKLSYYPIRLFNTMCQQPMYGWTVLRD